MIETPSLRTRVMVVTIGVVVLLVVVLEALVYLSLRDRLNDSLDDVLATRAALVQRLARDTADVDELRADLSELGLPAILRAADGTVLRSEPAARRLDEVLPGISEEGAEIAQGAAVETMTVDLPDGATAEVVVSRGAVDSTLQRIVLVEVVGSAAALLLAALLVLRASSVVTRPLDRIVDTALEIAAGDRSRRLHPSDPTTELGRMAATFDTTIDALDRALTEAEQAESRSRRFLADAAHQLRTPLAGLRASAETLLAHPDGPDRLRLAANVSREATRMSRLVDRLLRIARIDRGEEPERRPTDIEALARREVERQRPLAPQLEFAVTAVEDVPTVACDPEAVRDALANLLDNARRFARARVDVGVDHGVGTVELIVRDDGPGIPVERADQVFDRFTTTSEGSGLGLPIARGIAEAHGGELVFAGGAFVLTLPVAPLEG